MSDFAAFSEDIDAGMAFLEHHQILGAKWGKMNGPPYPLGRGDHSAAEKSAAQKAGIKVGEDSGKGSIENVLTKSSTSVQNKPKKPKKELTPEEKREKALEAVRSGDKKKIAKYINELSTDELRDAQTRSQLKDSLTKKDPMDQKASKDEMAKLEAIRSGDKEKVREYADKMSYNELSEAMNKIDLTQKLNYNPPPPSAMDKLTSVAKKIDQFRDVAEKGINAYNLAAKVYNSTHPDGTQWPIIKDQNQQKPGGSKEDQVAKQIANMAKQDISKGLKESYVQNQQKSYEEQSKETLKNAKIDYKREKEFEKWKEKQENKGKKPEKSSDEENTTQKKKTSEEASDEETITSDQIRKDAEELRKDGHEDVAKVFERYADTRDEISSYFEKNPVTKKSSTDHEYVKKEGEGEDAKYYYKEDTKKSSSSEAPSYDEVMTESVRDTMRRSVNSFNDVPSYDEIIPESVKAQMRETRFNMAMADTDYENLMDYAMRHSEV